jgi:hypothetical protein
MTLRRLTIKVRPAVQHPTYWDWQAGYLDVWLFCESDGDGVERAETIIAQLPYERAEQGAITVRDCDGKERLPEWAARESAAREIGLAVFLSRIATGGNERDFETADAP